MNCFDDRISYAHAMGHTGSTWNFKFVQESDKPQNTLTNESQFENFITTQTSNGSEHFDRGLGYFRHHVKAIYV